MSCKSDIISRIILQNFYKNIYVNDFFLIKSAQSII